MALPLRVPGQLARIPDALYSSGMWNSSLSMVNWSQARHHECHHGYASDWLFLCAHPLLIGGKRLFDAHLLFGFILLPFRSLSERSTVANCAFVFAQCMFWLYF